jgi:threonylcarbamoyladenosine tRNA methylthiotransferase MtaB
LPDAGIGADVIAGFPGETDAEHEETVAFIERLPFSYLHVFSFSQRPGTRAAELANHVPAPVIKNRARELRALGEKKMKEFRRSQVGRALRVLTLRDERECAETTPALSSNYLQVRLRGKFAANEWLDVTVADGGEGLIGEPTLSTLPSCCN